MRTIALICAVGLFTLASTAHAAGKGDKAQKIPITTTSDEARALYLDGRDQLEKLRANEAHTKFQAAVAKDPSFALAHLGVAQTSITAQEFFDSMKRASELAGKASEGEQLLIQFTETGSRGETDKQTAIAKRLASSFPGDERVHNLIGGMHFGRQQWKQAIEAYKRATAIDPAYSAPYNQLGYALRSMERYDEAEAAFKKYAELIPNDPNPYDSYAELLMRMGRFDESMKQYEKAAAVDKNFISAYVGIGNNQMFLGKTEDARASFARVTAVARNDGERRTALFWNAMSYVHDGATDKALAELEKMAAIDEAGKDLPNLSGVHFTMGEVLLEAGKADEALTHFKKQNEVMHAAAVPQAVKDQADRNLLYNEAKVALAKGDLAKAKANGAERAKKVQATKVLFELQQIHELNGRIALEEKKYAVAAAELAKANVQDARVLYLLGVARQGAGDTKGAKDALTRAADFNQLSGTYAFVRRKAKELLARS